MPLELAVAGVRAVTKNLRRSERDAARFDVEHEVVVLERVADTGFGPLVAVPETAVDDVVARGTVSVTEVEDCVALMAPTVVAPVVPYDDRRGVDIVYLCGTRCKDTHTDTDPIELARIRDIKFVPRIRQAIERLCDPSVLVRTVPRRVDDNGAALAQVVSPVGVAGISLTGTGRGQCLPCGAVPELDLHCAIGVRRNKAHPQS